MGTQTQKAKSMQGYVFRAQAVAAQFSFTNGHASFGDEYTLTVNSEKPQTDPYTKHTGGRKGPEISFDDSSVSISCNEASGVYTTIVKSSLTGFNVNGILTADLLEAGLVTVYRRDWYPNSKRARVLPLPPVIKNLRIHGQAIQLGLDVALPEPFHFDEARREKYLRGEGAEILPPRRRIATAKGEIRISSNGIQVPKFGMVYIADWTSWQPPKDSHPPTDLAHWMQLVRMELSNPGIGGGGGLGGDGTSYP